MLRLAIVGCGKIADQHVQALARLPDCRLVGVCDRELLMARQLGERFGVTECHSELRDLLSNVVPDVVHITTPPQSHFALASQCLEAGAHVYLEKPFTVTAPQAQNLIALAERVGRKITAGHNYLFTPEMLELRRLVAGGYLGGKAVHLESHWSYDLSDLSYVGPMLGNRNHWVRQLPGQLFHNLISHGIARLAEFLDDDLVELTASAHQSAQMRVLGGQEVLDELRVLLRDRSGTTAFFCFSTQLKPGRSQFRVCGPANSLLADQGSGSLVRLPSRSAKSYLTYFLPPAHQAWEHLRNSGINVTRFLRRKLYQDSGMTELIGRFFANIRAGGPPPIPYREIRLTAKIMDDIFAQVYPETRPAAEPERSPVKVQTPTMVS